MIRLLRQYTPRFQRDDISRLGYLEAHLLQLQLHLRPVPYKMWMPTNPTTQHIAIPLSLILEYFPLACRSHPTFTNPANLPEVFVVHKQSHSFDLFPTVVTILRLFSHKLMAFQT